MTILNAFSTAVNKRVRYRRTVAELKSLPLDTALDLNIHKEDAKKIASQAVYG